MMVSQNIADAVLAAHGDSKRPAAERTLRALSREFGVSRGCVKAIVEGKPVCRPRPCGEDGQVATTRHKCIWCENIIDREPCQICVALDAQMLGTAEAQPEELAAA